MKKIVLFASGSGTNVENIARYFQDSKAVKVVAVFCNNKKALVLEKAKQLHIPTFVFTKEELHSEIVLNKIQEFQPDLIILAGFLLQFPLSIINKYPLIINIHPALLPKYGGKGMYGMNVHRAVLENKETQTGITIHYVTENYDEGKFIFQEKIEVTDCKTAEEIAQKIHQLEQKFFPKVIENLLVNH
jgi:phosphoribosylglycinamide formyltransferase-1